MVALCFKIFFYLDILYYSFNATNSIKILVLMIISQIKAIYLFEFKEQLDYIFVYLTLPTLNINLKVQEIFLLNNFQCNYLKWLLFKDKIY